LGRGTGRRTPIRALLGAASEGAGVEVTGWIRTSRFGKSVAFVHVGDGSCADTLQLVLSDPDAELAGRLAVGAAVRARGRWVRSQGAEQAWEVAVDHVDVVGASDAATYPLQKKRTSVEHLRTIQHLRSRTNLHQAVVRVRNAASWQIHRFFQERGFHWIHTPILSASDAEGAGELFAVSVPGTQEPFFGRPTFLTVSGQLQVECFAQSHTDVYTFGPTFRAENSNTPRHAAEFWMIEPEMAFAELDDVVALAEEFVRQVGLATLEQCAGDFAFLDRFVAPGQLAMVRTALAAPFARVTYTEAQRILLASGRSFQYPIGWGTSLQAEHERYLAEEHFRGPVFVTNYPVEQKAFYMRLDPDGRTVSATDLLVPGIGEIIGGSQREERLDELVAQMRRRGMDPAHLDWYCDLRRWGSTPHGGFGLGLERLLMWLTGVANIRDVIAFPRTPGHAET
jgi:asparaginyl-tRNA synthetase